MNEESTIGIMLGLFMLSPFIFLVLFLTFHPYFKREKCPKGKYHDWEFKRDLEVIGEKDWRHNILMSINNHNILSTNERYECTKCGKIDKHKL